MCQPEPIDKIDELFNKLDNWRKLPKYALERRADIFFAIYLKEILNKCLKNPKPVIDRIIPEFPIKSAVTNHSCNIDYLCLSKEKLYFIELKTDIKSINKDQYKRMKDVKSASINELIDDIKTITENSTQWEKYVCLFKLLNKAELFKGRFSEIINIESKSKIKEVTWNKFKEEPDIECIYIIPKETDEKGKELKMVTDIKNDEIKVITFKKIIGIDKFINTRDTFLIRFLGSLSKWANLNK